MLAHRYIAALVLLVSVAFATASAQRRHGPPTPRQQGRQQDSRSDRPPVFEQWRGQNQGSQNDNARDKRDDRRRNDANNGPHGGDWLRNHSNLPPKEQQRALDSDPEFRKLPPDMQDRLRNRLQRFNSLPADQQQRMLQRMDRWNRLNQGQRDRARGLFQQFRELPQDRRNAMAQAFRSLRAFPPDQQQRMLDSPHFRNSFSDSERDIMRGMTELNVGPHEGSGTGENEQ